jgi:hypothetical protein
MDTTVNFYEPIEVWRRVSESEMVRYRCFRNSLTRRYSVQSSDFYQFPIDPKRASFLEHQHMELFVQAPPDERVPSFENLLDAIKAHDVKFSAS